MDGMPRTSRGTSPADRHRFTFLRGRALTAVAGAAVLAVAALAAPAGAHPVAAPVPTRVVVTGPDMAAAVAAVRAAGGVVVAELPLVDGVTAQLPGEAVLPAEFRVTPDRAVAFAGSDPSPDAAVSTVRATLGLPPNGQEGDGVTVALVDTGVAEVPDLQGRVVAHVDVTGTGRGDGYGHGTFLAGLIAGSGAASGGAYLGVAPGTRILDVKVARPDGSSDLFSVLAGLQVVANSGHRYGVGVVNLALSSGSPVPYQVDPLDQALRALWRQGYAVVVPAGNEGPAAGTISAPGNDPALLTVGALDEHGTAARTDDTVAVWSGRGPTSQGVAKPELVAPGESVIGLRSPGSVIDGAYPQARVGSDYFRGSGTSMSTAVVSGAVADLLARAPQLAPDGVKALLTDTAYRADGLGDPTAAGAGGTDLAAALELSDHYGGGTPGESVEPAPDPPGRWLRLAEALRAGDLARAQKAWDALSPQARSWAARSWAALDPQTQEWVARSWVARSWASTGVSLQEWAARSWAARSWAGEDWAARSWAARSWADVQWLARSWAGEDWTARSWAARSWVARSWTARWG
ncbi:MAG TPA: S8 family peptidase [Kineosporiaceae bacterium]|nr:S8 family peptidase [Kineosporiaceae bacterium]